MKARIHSNLLGWVTDDELRVLLDRNEILSDDIREWLRQSDSDFVYEQMDELRDAVRFEVDAWNNVYAHPCHSAARCGDFARAFRGSIYSYPSSIESALTKLERYAEGVDRLGGSIWLLPSHFEEAIEKQQRIVCDAYESDLKSALDWWLDADDSVIFEYFADDIDNWLSSHPEIVSDFVDTRDGVRNRHKSAISRRRSLFSSRKPARKRGCAR